ncbi:MAG: glycosyltransferase 87 family protein, partial [Myxococcaceae bacterium]
MNDDLVNKLQFFLAAGGLALLGWGYFLAQKGREKEERRTRNRLLMVLGLLGALAYPNFGWLHFGAFVHTWDTYHYYVGSKYFPELGYDRLYECTALADNEAGFTAVVARRTFTDLRTNVMVGTGDILAHPEQCKSHFSAERWVEFRHDVGWFRGRVVPDRWEAMQRDHGYNATPVWNMVGHALSTLAPASEVPVGLLNLLDPLLLLGMAWLIYWAFGWRALALAMLVLGTDYANRYFWTGGAFLRHDWLFFTVAYVCLLKKERPLLAGLAIAYAATLRLFPVLMLVGPILAAIEILRAEKRLDRRYLKLFGGAALGVALLLPASLLLSGGTETYRRFIHNTQKHAATPLTNHMGLRTAVSYRPSNIGAILRDGRATDPWAKWKEARLNTFHQSRLVFAAA